MFEYTNCFTMDDENVEKFKKLYGEGRRIDRECSWLLDEGGTYKYSVIFFSFSMVIPEPTKDESADTWFDKTKQDVWAWRHMIHDDRDPEAEEFLQEIEKEMEQMAEQEGFKIESIPKECLHTESEMIGQTLKKWRTDNWGTPSDVLYDEDEVPYKPTLEGLLKGEFPFYTFEKPPIKIYEKMAADGLVFETKWGSSAFDEWAVGKGQVVDGQFQYHIGPITGSEKMLLLYAGDRLLDPKESPNDRSTIVVKNREHLDQLIQLIQGSLEDALYMGGPLKFIREISKNTIILNNVIDLNFLDVSNVTDLSYLFANFDVSPYPKKGWFCKIKLDISKWNVSNVTKMAHLLDNERVDLGDLSKWDRSKVTDC